MKKQPIKSIYFIKAICAIGIIIFHFGCHATGIDPSLITVYANGDWGGTLVTVFFSVSGALLYYHYSEGQIPLSQYYWRRWKGIYPMFYLAYFCCMLVRVYQYKTLFYYDAPWAYGVTLLGMDGYWIHSVGSYYILGEWFLGAIVMMYLIFPAILPLWRKNHIATFSLILVIYILFYDKPITNAIGFRTVSSCLISFVFGILFIEHRKCFVSTIGITASLLGCVLLYAIQLPVSANMANHLLGFCLLIIMTAVGEHVMQYRPAEKLFKTLGALSYPIFLVHHEILKLFLSYWQPRSAQETVFFLIVTIGIIIPTAKILSVVSGRIVKSLECFLARITSKSKVAL